MFRQLRHGLTSLYLLAAVLLLVLIGGGTYQLVDSYFRGTTDSALQHKMTHEFLQRGLPVPAELVVADNNWYTSRGQQPPLGSSSAAAPPPDNGGKAGDGDEHGGQQPPHDTESQIAIEDAYIGELASIFTLPLDGNGEVLSNTTSPAAPIGADEGAVAAAMQNGVDWRTIQAGDGTRVRLLTYRLPSGASTSGGHPAPALLQLGRTLSDQDAVLQRLLIGLLALGGISTLLLGFASWWLAGRSLRPAQQAWERQQQFVANASHELRAPLTLMRASTEVALRSTPAKDVDQRALLSDVLQECDHMNTLVEDLLLLSRLDAGRLTLERQVVPLGDILSDVQRQVGRVTEARGVRLVVGNNSANLSVVGDATRLRQVLLILLDNALRYTPQGGVIEIAVVPHGRQIELTVTDTGKGIAPEYLPHIFERFYRVEEARGEEGKGNGLGLSIAKGLVEAQGGHIGITSKPGQGTQVTLILHASGAAGNAPQVKAKAPA